MSLTCYIRVKKYQPVQQLEFKWTGMWFKVIGGMTLDRCTTTMRLRDGWMILICTFIADFLRLLDSEKLWSCGWHRSRVFVLVSHIQNFPLCSLFFVIGWFRIEPVFFIILLLGEQAHDCSGQFYWFVNVVTVAKQAWNKLSKDIRRYKGHT